MKSVVIREGSRVHALVFFYFPANGLTNLDVFKPKTIGTLKGIIPQNFSSLGFAVLKALGNKQTDDSLHPIAFEE